MLYAIHNGFVEGYAGGQEQVLHLVGSAEAVAKEGLRYCFTDGHAEIVFSVFFEDVADLPKVDWDVMKAQYWSDYKTDPDRKRRRQAEFLVHGFFPWKMLTQIGVSNERVAKETEKAIVGCLHKPFIVVAKQWYY